MNPSAIVVMICCGGEENRIVKISEDLEACIQKKVSKYASDLRTLAVYLTRGYDGVGGVLVLGELERRHPEAYKEFREITRAAREDHGRQEEGP